MDNKKNHSKKIYRVIVASFLLPMLASGLLSSLPAATNSTVLTAALAQEEPSCPEGQHYDSIQQSCLPNDDLSTASPAPGTGVQADGALAASGNESDSTESTSAEPKPASCPEGQVKDESGNCIVASPSGDGDSGEESTEGSGTAKESAEADGNVIKGTTESSQIEKAANGDCLLFRITFESMKIYDIRDPWPENRNYWTLLASVNGGPSDFYLLHDEEVGSDFMPYEHDLHDKSLLVQLDPDHPSIFIDVRGYDDDFNGDILGRVLQGYDAKDNFGIGFHDVTSGPDSSHSGLFRDEDSGGEYDLRYTIERACGANTGAITTLEPSQLGKVVEITNPQDGSNFFDAESGEVLVELKGQAYEGTDCDSNNEEESTYRCAIVVPDSDISWLLVQNGQQNYLGGGHSMVVGLNAGCGAQVEHTILMEAKFPDGTTQSDSIKITTGKVC